MSDDETCAARIRPFTDDTEIACETAGVHDDHEGVVRDFAYPGSKTLLKWADTDRRCFRGEWIECPQRGCVLPAGHRGDHAS
jgi:hypothetical protein